MTKKFSIYLSAIIMLCSGCQQSDSKQALPNDVYPSSDSRFPGTERMQLLLVSELSKSASVVALGYGLYFFRVANEDALTTIDSYLKENTNLTLIVLYPASENYSMVWKTGDGTMINLKDFPVKLHVTNGTFAVFRDK